VVALAADRDHQRVVGEGARRSDFLAVLVHEGRDVHLARAAVEPGHLPDAEAEAVPVRLREVGDLVVADIHAAGGDLMQLGLPDVGALAVDERDLGLAIATELASQASGQLQAPGATADDDDAVRRSIHALAHRCLYLRDYLIISRIPAEQCQCPQPGSYECNRTPGGAPRLAACRT